MKSPALFPWAALVVTMWTISTCSAQVAVLQRGYDRGCTGANLQETVLTPDAVASDRFGKLWSYQVNGQVYAQPLLVPNLNMPGRGPTNVLFVVTMTDNVYAFDADSNTLLWHVDYRVPAAGIVEIPIETLIAREIIHDIYPVIGIMATPVVDTATNTIYILSRTMNNVTAIYFQHLHAVDMMTGAEKFGGPVEIRAAVPGTGGPTAWGSEGGTINFDPKIQLQRTSLALVNGHILLAWASHSDQRQYHGWVMAYNAATLQPTSVWCSTPEGRRGGIWMGGKPPAIDEQGNAYFAVSNGDYDGVSNFGQSFVKLSTAGGQLGIVDWFTDHQWAMLNVGDADLGTTGPLLLPDTDLFVTNSKAGTLYLVSRNDLGRNVSGNTQIEQSFYVGNAKAGGVYWNLGGGRGRFYIWPDAAFMTHNEFNLTKFVRPARKTGTLRVSNNQGAALTLSANGATLGSGIVWAVHATEDTYLCQPCLADGILHAYDAEDITRELWSSDNDDADAVGLVAKFSPPTVANGRVYLATFSNAVHVYGLSGTSASSSASASSSTTTSTSGGAGGSSSSSSAGSSSSAFATTAVNGSTGIIRDEDVSAGVALRPLSAVTVVVSVLVLLARQL